MAYSLKDNLPILRILDEDKANTVSGWSYVCTYIRTYVRMYVHMYAPTQVCQISHTFICSKMYVSLENRETHVNYGSGVENNEGLVGNCAVLSHVQLLVQPFLAADEDYWECTSSMTRQSVPTSLLGPEISMCSRSCWTPSASVSLYSASPPLG